MHNETFFSLLRDPAHWGFEIFLMILFDFILGVLIWPRIKRALKHHTSDDLKIAALENDVAEMRKILGLEKRK
jgi:hypothetical protein